MAFSGKIFDNTPSGKRFKKLRDEGLAKCLELQHSMDDTYKRINNKHENNLTWTCVFCGHNMFINFKNKAEVKGGALMNKCPKRQWL